MYSPTLMTPTFIAHHAKKNYKTRADYRQHIRIIYPSVELENLKKPSNITALMVEMDTGDHNKKRCTICEREYSNRQSYKNHMSTAHKDGEREPTGVRLKSRLRTNTPREEIDAGNQNNTRYTICERDYSGRYKYRKHMYHYHKNDKREPVALPEGKKANMDTSVIPLWNDPNYYCRSCRRTYSCKRNYRYHIKTLHSEALQQAMQLSASTSM